MIPDINAPSISGTKHDHFTALATLTPNSRAVSRADSPLGGRWGQLILGVLCMSMIANLQYGWTVFVNPIHDKFQWTRAEIQIAFTARNLGTQEPIG